METMQFEVGDRVICRRPMSGNRRVIDATGTVVVSRGREAGVLFDLEMGGHDLSGRLSGAESKRGYWVSNGFLELLIEEPDVSAAYVPYDAIF